MRLHVLQSAGLGIVNNNPPRAYIRERLSSEPVIATSGEARKHVGGCDHAVLYPGINMMLCLDGERCGTGFDIRLTDNPHGVEVALLLNLFDRQGYQLAKTHTRGGERMQHGTVAQAKQRSRIR